MLYYISSKKIKEFIGERKFGVKETMTETMVDPENDSKYQQMMTRTSV